MVARWRHTASTLILCASVSSLAGCRRPSRTDSLDDAQCANACFVGMSESHFLRHYERDGLTYFATARWYVALFRNRQDRAKLVRARFVRADGKFILDWWENVDRIDPLRDG